MEKLSYIQATALYWDEDLSTDATASWLGTYKIYLWIATALCVISPVMYVFRAGFPELSYFGTSVVRIVVFASAAATASRLADPSIRGFHLGLNAAGAAMGLLYMLMRISFVGSLPLISDIAQSVGWIVVVPWSVVVPSLLYSMYTVVGFFGLVAASIWAYLLGTYEHSTPASADDYNSNTQVVDHDNNHNIRRTPQRKPWRPLLISFLFALAINLIPFAVIEFDNQEYGWLLFIITVPVGGLILVIGLIWSIVLVSNKH